MKIYTLKNGANKPIELPAKKFEGQASKRSGAEALFADIESVIELCSAALPDASVEREVVELRALKLEVKAHWPLSVQVKNRIDLGAFAAKNIADWNPKLADALMNLDFALRHGGESSVEASPVASSPNHLAARSPEVREL